MGRTRLETDSIGYCLGRFAIAGVKYRTGEHHRGPRYRQGHT